MCVCVRNYNIAAESSIDQKLQFRSLQMRMDKQAIINMFLIKIACLH